MMYLKWHRVAVQKHKKTSPTKEPRGQPFVTRRSQDCKEQTKQHDRHETQLVEEGAKWHFSTFEENEF